MREHIDPDVACYLLEQYPGTTREDLRQRWNAARSWVRQHVADQHKWNDKKQPPMLDAAAISYVRYLCEPPGFNRQAFALVAAEICAVYGPPPRRMTA